MRYLSFLWKKHPFSLSVFILACAFMLFFAVRAWLGFIYFMDPAHKDQTIEGWMTPRYVALSYDLPKEVMLEALQIEPGEGRRKTLEKLAEERGTTLEALVQTILAAVEKARAEKGGQRE